MKTTGLTVAFLLLAPSLLFAQAQGRLKGIVKNSQGQRVADAKVTITTPAITDFRKDVTTDKEGIFLALFVDATQQYLVHIEAPGYRPLEQWEKPPIGGATRTVEFTLTSVQEAQQEAQQKILESPGMKAFREGRALVDQGKTAEAYAKFQAAVLAQPDLYGAWFHMSNIDLEGGKTQQALDEAKKCLGLSSDYAPCLAVAANASKALGDTAAFAKYMEAYKAANPDDPAVLFNQAAAYLNKGDDAKAKPLLEQALESNPNYGNALFQLGMLYVRAGNNAKAKELLEKFIKVAPDSKDAPTAKEMLKYL